MALRVISKNLSDRGGVVTVHGDTQEEVMSHSAKQMAIMEASSRGISKAGISGKETPYPVNAEGECPEDLILARNGQKVAGYRCDYHISGGI